MLFSKQFTIMFETIRLMQILMASHAVRFSLQSCLKQYLINVNYIDGFPDKLHTGNLYLPVVIVTIYKHWG